MPRENFRVTRHRWKTHKELGGLAELRRLRRVTFRGQHSREEEAATKGEPKISAFKFLLEC